MTFVEICISLAVVCLLAESLATLIFHRRTRWRMNKEADAYRLDGADWVDRYAREWDQVQRRFSWTPFAYWRSRPFVGEQIRVSPQGLRVTAPRGGKSSDGRSCTIFCFGGSTMWGAGVRDSKTIPSLIASGLVGLDVGASVVNMAQIGYVSTQSVIALTKELQAGSRPDLVIFYDGYNDILSAIENGCAGRTIQEKHRDTEFKLSGDRVRLLAALMANFRILNLLLGRDVRRLDIAYGKEDEEGLAERICGVYVANLRVVESLAKAFDFRYLFYWQPTILHKASLSDFERKQASDLRSVGSLFENVYSRMRELADGTPRLIYLADLFQDQSRPYFIDYAHVTEAGNHIIAQRMLRDILPLIQP